METIKEGKQEVKEPAKAKPGASKKKLGIKKGKVTKTTQTKKFADLSENARKYIMAFGYWTQKLPIITDADEVDIDMFYNQPPGSQFGQIVLAMK